MFLNVYDKDKAAFFTSVPAAVALVADNDIHARIDTGRGSLICTTASEFYIDMRQTPLFGPASLHSMDYGLYYDNLVRNVRTRTEAYLAGRRSGPAAGPSPS